MRLYFFITSIFLMILSCKVENRKENISAFTQIQHKQDTLFLKNEIVDSIKLCYTTLTDLKNQGSLFTELKYDELDTLIKEYRSEGEHFYLDEERKLILGTYSDTELISSIWLLNKFKGNLLNKTIDLENYSVKQMLVDFPNFDWSTTGASQYWRFTNNIDFDTTVFYIKVDNQIEKFPLDEKHYYDHKIDGIKMELSCWNIYGPKFGKKDTVLIKPLYSPFNHTHMNYYLEHRKPGIQTTIREITTAGKKSIYEQKRIGKWMNFDPDHSLRAIEYYNNGHLIKKENTTYNNGEHP